MIYEMRTYTIKIGGLNNYIKHFEEVGLPIISQYAKLVGYWFTEFGELNQIIHIWAYEDLNTRSKQRQKLLENKGWREDFLPTAMALLEKQESVILNPSSFSPIR